MEATSALIFVLLVTNGISLMHFKSLILFENKPQEKDCWLRLQIMHYILVGESRCLEREFCLFDYQDLGWVNGQNASTTQGSLCFIHNTQVVEEA